MFYVYIIRSINYSEIIYVGYTTNLEQRLETHNFGGSIHTAKYKPWKLEVSLTFNDEQMAKNFEKYLKSQSGRAFMKKRLIKID
jgi:putative endonuclease